MIMQPSYFISPGFIHIPICVINEMVPSVRKLVFQLISAFDGKIFTEYYFRKKKNF